MSTQGPDQVVFVCSHGYRFTAIEVEMGMTHGTMRYLMEEQEREHNFESDTSIERDLGVAFLEDDAQEQWPWYADAQWEVQEPEIIEP